MEREAAQPAGHAAEQRGAEQQPPARQQQQRAAAEDVPKEWMREARELRLSQQLAFLPTMLRRSGAAGASPSGGPSAAGVRRVASRRAAPHRPLSPLGSNPPPREETKQAPPCACVVVAGDRPRGAQAARGGREERGWCCVASACPARARAKESKESKPAPRKEPSAAPRRRVHRGALTDLSGWGSLARQNDFGHLRAMAKLGVLSKSMPKV